MEVDKIKKIAVTVAAGVVMTKVAEKVFDKSKEKIKKVINPDNADEYLKELAEAFDE